MSPVIEQLLSLFNHRRFASYGGARNLRRVTAGILCAVAGVVVGVLLPRADRSQPVSESSRIALPPEQAWQQPEVLSSGDAGVRVLELIGAPASLARDAALAGALAEMTEEDFAKHAAELRTLLKPKLWDSELEDSVFDLWFQRAPSSARSAALAELEAEPSPFLRSWWLGCIARHDPQLAIGYLREDAAAGFLYANDNTVIIREIAKNDPKLAALCLRKFENSPSRPELLRGYVEGLTRGDPLAAMDAALTDKSYRRNQLIPTAVKAAAKAGSGTARLALARIADSAERRSAAWAAAGVIAEESVTSPFEFLTEAAGLDHPLGKDDVMWAYSEQTLDTLIERDSKEAVGWALTLPEENRKLVLAKLLASWSETDPDAVLAWSKETEPQVTPGAELTAGAPEPRSREAALAAAANLSRLMSAQKLLERGQIMEALQVSPSELHDVPGGMVERFVLWAANDAPAEVADWATRLPEDIRDSVVNRAAEQYAKSSPSGAADWVEQMPKGSTRDAALLGIARVLTRSDPTAAGAWVAEISTPAKLEEGVEAIWDHYVRFDEAAAREWLNQLSRVSQRTKRRLLGL